MMRGIFVTLEGGEGAGKTTIMHAVAKELEKRGYDVMQTREPGGIKIAEQIRGIILDTNNTEMDVRCEALLYAAARRQHLIEKVQPALRENKIVLCDRFIDSSIVYQGIARGIGVEEVWHMNQFAIEGNMPEVTIFFDLTPEAGLARIAANEQREVNRLDLEGIKFHELVYQGYKQQCEKHPNRIVSINASESIEAVTQTVLNLILEKLT